MKTTRETMGQTTCIIFISVLILISVTLSLTTTFFLENIGMIHNDDPFYYVIILFVLLTCLYMILMIKLVHMITGRPIFGDLKAEYIDAYKVTAHPTLTARNTTVDVERAKAKIEIYTEYTYQEIQAAYNAMRWQGNVSYTFRTIELPQPYRNITMAISRRTASRILQQMTQGQYVVLRSTYTSLYRGEEYSPQICFVSRKEVSRFRQHLASLKTNEKNFVASPGCLYRITTDDLERYDRIFLNHYRDQPFQYIDIRSPD